VFTGADEDDGKRLQSCKIEYLYMFIRTNGVFLLSMKYFGLLVLRAYGKVVSFELS